MSTNLYWRPAPKDVPPLTQLPYGLKHVLARRFWEHDGSLRGEVIQIGREHIPYLEGIRDGGTGEVTEGATELISAIREHDAVELLIDE